MSKTNMIKTYLGTVHVTQDTEHQTYRRASGDTDASSDFSATFTQDTLTVTGKSERDCMEQMASELQSMATALMFNARRLYPKR